MRAIFIVSGLQFFIVFEGEAQGTWNPGAFNLPTCWSNEAGPQNALPEYPRPQLVRPEWVNLNGLWNYAILDSTKIAIGTLYDGKILVTYPIESALSGVKKALLPNQRLWYHRTLLLKQVNQH